MDIPPESPSDKWCSNMASVPEDNNIPELPRLDKSDDKTVRNPACILK